MSKTVSIYDKKKKNGEAAMTLRFSLQLNDLIEEEALESGRSKTEVIRRVLMKKYGLLKSKQNKED